MAEWVIDLGDQLYGRRHFAVYGTVGDTWVPFGDGHAFCCWRDFDEESRREYEMTMREGLRPSPFGPHRDLSWIPDDCGHH